MSHQGVRHYCVQKPACSIRETFLDKLKRCLRLGNPEPKEGRKRIVPGTPYGNWAEGWEPITMPGQKNPVRNRD